MRSWNLRLGSFRLNSGGSQHERIIGLLIPLQVKSSKPGRSGAMFESKEVTAEVLTSNLITEPKTRFQTEVFCLSLIFFHLPPAYLCTDATFVSVLRTNTTHDYREIDPENKRGQDDHIQTMALNMLFYSYSRSLRKMQTQVGIFLHAAGAKDQIIRVFEEYGTSVGLDSIGKILETLAKRQQIKLRDIGKTIIDSPYNIVYDNINKCGICTQISRREMKKNKRETKYFGLETGF
jgi:hypothetical protein